MVRAGAGVLAAGVLLAPLGGPALEGVAAATRAEEASVQSSSEEAARRHAVDVLAREAADHRAAQARRLAVDRAVAAELADRVAGAGAAAARASRSEERAVLPDCSGLVAPGATETNGALPAEALCPLWDGESLRADAAVALAELSRAYEGEFGEHLVLVDGYRTLDEQHVLARTRSGFAAEPGTSDHGWGLAVDLGGGVADGGERYEWLRAHAPAFGWDNPAWARPGGSGPTEPWHWELVEAVAAVETGTGASVPPAPVG